MLVNGQNSWLQSERTKSILDSIEIEEQGRHFVASQAGGISLKLRKTWNQYFTKNKVN